MKRINKKQRNILDIHRELLIRESDVKDKEEKMKLLLSRINNSLICGPKSPFPMLNDYICEIEEIPGFIRAFREEQERILNSKTLDANQAINLNKKINKLKRELEQQQLNVDSLILDKIKYQNFIIKLGVK